MWFKLKYILFIFLIIGMLLPAFQKGLHLFEVQPLHGDFNLAQKPEFDASSWLAGTFQNQYDSYLEQHIGFRPFFVRSNNQIDFSCYRKANAEGVVIGKDDNLYEYDYIRAYTGKDFVGEMFITEKMNRLKFVQTYLKDSMDIDLVLVFEPGKASFYPEYIPDRFYKSNKPETNYATYRQTAEDIDITFLDLNQYFLSLKNTAQYPLFPKYGTHWSIYGMSFAVDTLLKTIEKIRNINLRLIRHDSVYTSFQALKTDDDVEKPMNLLFSLPPVELAYPLFEFGKDNTLNKPMVLAVADSYYWNIFNTQIPKKVFANEAFWYFNAKVYPEFYTQPLYVRDLNLQEEIEKQDVIFLMVTERFLYNFDWGFVDDVYNLYTPEEIDQPVYGLMNNILRNEVWFKNIILKASKKNSSLENVLWDEADYLFRSKEKEKYIKYFGINYFIGSINADKKWIKRLQEESKDKNLSLEKLVRKNAEYIFKKDYPDIYKKFKLRQQHIKTIKNDSRLLQKAIELSRYYHCPFDRAMWYQASLMLNKKQ